MTAAARIEPTDWIRSPIDAPLARKSVAAARRALLTDGLEPSPREIVFRLLREAAQTEASFKSDGPRGHVSCMPEVYHTNGEIFATEVAMVADNITYPPIIRVAVTASAASRYLEVTKWLRYVRGKTKERGKMALWMMAKNYPPFVIARETGYKEGSPQRGAKFRLLGQIVERLEKEDIFS